MRILIVGSGAREQALTWKISKSSLLTKLYRWPGTAGLHDLGEPLGLDEHASVAEVARAASQLKIGLVIMGSEYPVTQGLANALQVYRIPCFGPTRVEAHFQWDLAYLKQLLSQKDIPSVPYFMTSSLGECRELALGVFDQKRVLNLKLLNGPSRPATFTLQSPEQVDRFLANTKAAFELSDERPLILLESLEDSRQCSFFTFVGPHGVKSMGFAMNCVTERMPANPSQARGHAALTMGAHTPIEWLPSNAAQLVEKTIVRPFIEALHGEGIDYCGWLNLKLIWGARGPQVVDLKCCLGSREAPVLALSDERDWLALMMSVMGMPVGNVDVSTLPNGASHRPACAVIVSDELMQKIKLGDRLTGLAARLGRNHGEDAMVFGHLSRPATLSHGIGHYDEDTELTFVAKGPDFETARSICNTLVNEIVMEGFLA